MASKYLQKFPVPHGFQEILADLTKEILRGQPQNIVEFAAVYFQNLEKGIKSQSSNKSMEGVSSKQADEITKKASNIASHVGQ